MGHDLARLTRRGWAAGAASALAYGSMAVAAVFAYRDGTSPAVLLTLRGVLGTAVIAALWLLTGRARRLPWRPAACLLLLCGPLFGAQVLAFFMAVERGGAQIPVIVVNVCPLIVIALVWLRDRAPVPKVLIVLACTAIAGLVMVGGAGSGSVSLAAVGLALLSAAGYAGYLVLGERWVPHVGTVAASGLVTFGSTVTTAVVAVVADDHFAVPMSVWMVAAIQGIVLMTIGMGGALYAVRTLGSVPLSLLGALEPVIGIALAAILLGERLGPSQWIGVAVILIACAAVPFITGRRAEPTAAAQHPLNGLGAGESPLPES
ncbi:DMT family transporter [Mycolicibacterium sp. J2]|uniref:DMT family transporter n=1 Tax=Mycolicibacterium sp. J2 TaxID=2993511 RepID=UPI00224A74B5|nr:EamA family transporter [Mycolicibacterium sp. J2]MCX2712422.1 EamA family transporter [Mycolicibacterium sp. J2]